MKRLIDAYLYRKKDHTIEFLVLKRAKNKIYSGQWRMVGGKLKENESYTQAALREIKEETGSTPVSFWTIPSINTFFEHESNTIHLIPAFAAEIESTVSLQLNNEHTNYEWITIDSVEDFIKWPEQVRLMKMAHDLLISNSILPEWIIKA
mgnify:CR=1 FL=1